MDTLPPILFFDGECGLCARSVQWTLLHDRRARLRFAPLQGTTYSALDVPEKPTDLRTLVLYEDGMLHLRSSGALRLLLHCAPGWRVLARVLLLVPRPVRDMAYDFVARRRLRWFGSADSCRLPSASESVRFLP